MNRTLLVSAVVLALSLCAVGVMAQMKVVTLKDGRTVVGKVTLKGDQYEVVGASGQAVKLPASEVVSVTKAPSKKEQYQKKLLMLEPGDVKGHYDLAAWCEKQDLLQEAKAELKAVLKLRPEHKNALLLLPVVEARLRDLKQPTGGSTKPPKPLEGLLTKLMGQEDIERIRLAELRSRDKVSITFANDVVQRYIGMREARGEFSREEFLRKSPVAKAVDMLVHFPDVSDLQADIHIKSNPRFMTTFKTSVWPNIVSRSCATNSCHGSAKGAGNLKLYNVKIKDDRVFYTNFYILNQFKGRRGKMIDRGRPAQSLLLQYGLPEKLASAKHPGGPLPRPAYRSTRNKKYRMVDDWIRSLWRPRPKYPVKFKIPGEKEPLPAADAPETRPVDAPVGP